MSLVLDKTSIRIRFTLVFGLCSRVFSAIVLASWCLYRVRIAVIIVPLFRRLHGNILSCY